MVGIWRGVILTILYLFQSKKQHSVNIHHWLILKLAWPLSTKVCGANMLFPILKALDSQPLSFCCLFNETNSLFVKMSYQALFLSALYQDSHVSYLKKKEFRSAFRSIISYSALLYLCVYIYILKHTVLPKNFVTYQPIASHYKVKHKHKSWASSKSNFSQFLIRRRRNKKLCLTV